MSIKAVLFDLDGTLLPMNQDDFVKVYFKEISAYLYKNGGYEPEQFMKSMWMGIGSMLKNDGARTNEEAFWRVFYGIYGEEKVKNDYPLFEKFYLERFPNTRVACGYTEGSRKVIDIIKSKGIKVALATNPVFPAVATYTRMGWVNLKPEEFELVTTYDNIGYCKPNPDYYTDIAKRIGVDPCQCLMVGNDVADDMPAKLAGMDVFLLTDCLINSKNEDISSYPQGGFQELIEYIMEKTQEN